MLKPIPELVAEARQTLRCLKAEDAMVEQKENHGLIIDVREPEEVAQTPAPESINIPRGVLEMKVSANYPHPEQPIYIHCASGARATFAAEQLQRVGYTNVTVITCPIDTVCDEQNC
ncbi:MAG: rhodanese-like domain-containing protein [Cellvibrionaceae bacterium]|nr:rhodanese-like domain-containing protein [Cellvibrionaceae bacterium]MCV6625413.1 rhodanese-like domain-containing protein [Cellvibrionaceae bacterium]